MSYSVIVTVPGRWLDPATYGGVDLDRSGVVRASPFRPRPPNRIPFGRRVAPPPIPGGPRLPGPLPLLGTLLLIGEGIDRLRKQPMRVVIPVGSPWYIARDCGISGDAYLTAGATTDPGDPFGGCYLGQYSWDYDLPVDFASATAADEKTIIIGRKVDQGFPQRYDTALKLSRFWWSPGWWDPALYPQVSPQRITPISPPAPPGFDVPPGVYSEPDPNIWRPATPQPANPWTAPAPALPPPEIEIPRFRIEIIARPQVGVGTAAGPGTVPNVPQPEPETDVTIIPAPPPPAPAPPKSNEKEKKVKTKGKAAAILAYRILDGISEVGDMVDAVYKSLPAALRRRIEGRQRKSVRGLDRGRTQDGRRVYYDPVSNTWKTRRQIGNVAPAPYFRREGAGDQMGQYGIGGMDWKLRAIWDHWDQVDAPSAVRNLIANEIEDRAYGRAYAARDRLTLRGRNRPPPLYRDRGI